VAVDDAGGRGEQGRGARERRLERKRLPRFEPAHVLDTVAGRRPRDRLELRVLVRAGGDDELPAAAVRDAVFLAVAIEALAPLDAQACLERSRRIVDAGVDD